MKKIFSLLSLGVVLTYFSCTTDFQLEGDWKDIPVAYAFLNPNDTAHYIRIEKAFLEPGGNALQVAQIPDSIYYDELSVQIEKINSGEAFLLQRVDGNLEGYPREDGPFATSPNYLYKVLQNNIQLEGGDMIRVMIDRGEEKELVTAETIILNDIVPVESRPGSEIKLNDYDSELNISWTPGEEAKVFDIRFIIHYKESVPGSPGEFTEKELEWVVVRSLRRSEATSGSARLVYSVRWEEFYIFLSSQIDETQERSRIFTNMDLQITAAGSELEEFLDIADANVGITSSQAVPVYTNLSEGLGVITSRNSVLRTGLVLRSNACDSLRNGLYTVNLNFMACE